MTSTLRITTALAGLTLAGSAFAADLPRRAPPPVFTPVPVFTWTGAYFGVNAGYITSTKDTVNTAGVFPANTGVITGNRPGALTLPKDGFTGGGQVGYNYQFTPGSGVVVGIEADAAYTDLSRTRSFLGTAGGISTFRQSQDFLGTVRGRLGYAFDRTLVYATGGFAYGSGSADRSFGGFAGNDSFRTGYAVGGGIEYPGGWALSRFRARRMNFSQSPLTKRRRTPMSRSSTRRVRAAGPISRRTVP